MALSPCDRWKKEIPQNLNYQMTKMLYRAVGDWHVAVIRYSGRWEGRRGGVGGVGGGVETNNREEI